MDLDGAIDLHVHSAPDVYDRIADDHDIARQAAEAGMRAVLLKSHHTLTADRATLAGRAAGGALVFGGLVLNHSVGGLNPVAVETAIEFGARQIWMPTLHAAHGLAVADAPMFQGEATKGHRGIRVFEEDGTPAPGLLPILEMIRDRGVILGSGHISPFETAMLARLAKDLGIERMLVTHPLMSFVAFTHSQLREVVELGATLELVYLSCCPGWHRAVSPEATAAAIRAVGPEHCVLASDGGQHWNLPPTEMLRAFGRELGDRGIGGHELRLMTCETPARLLDL